MQDLITQLEIFSNPFNLSFIISGTKGQKNHYYTIYEVGEGRSSRPLFQSDNPGEKTESVSYLRKLLLSTLENSRKVLTIFDGRFPENSRYLTKEMVTKIAETLEDEYSLNTSTKDWKRMFLTKEDGLVEGQEVSITYVSGPEKGKTIEGVLACPIKITFMFRIGDNKYDNSPVTDIVKEEDGSYTVFTKDYNAKVIITNTRE